MEFLSGAYFEVSLFEEDDTAVYDDREEKLAGRFTSVSGLNMELEYEVYSEGGSNYPRFFLKESKPQVLVLEQGVIVEDDAFSQLMSDCLEGRMVPLQGTVTLKDSFGKTVRTWCIENAYLQKYVGPELNSNQPALAVTRVELIYNGCF